MRLRVLSALVGCALAALAALAAAPAEARRLGNAEHLLGLLQSPLGDAVAVRAEAKAGEDVRAKAGAGLLRLAQDQNNERGAQRAPAPTQTPAFGTPNVVFVVGIWRIVRSSGEFYLWAENGDRAIQVTLDSNGWWGLRRQSDEKIVWSSGRTGEGPFYERPWLRGAGATFQISTGYYEGTGTQGITVIRVANDQILITLTDRGEIQLNIRARTIIFRTGRGETLTF